MIPAQHIAELYRRIASNIEYVVHGKPGVLRLVVTSLFAEGHLLIEDLPGLGKTSIARSLARCVGGLAQRVQFTPDVLPSDITGVMVFNQQSGTFEFHHGPVFANVLLADEVNRGTPKVQSALLEAMSERSVTVDKQTHLLPRPFMVVATQNPMELDGTYRLPEAQLDRFMMRIEIGYPDHDAEVRAIQGDARGVSPDELPAVVEPQELRQIIQSVSALHADPEICSYAVRLAAATRTHRDVRYGASPRGSIALVRAARAWAATAGRDFVNVDDLKELAVPVLAHRVVLTPQAELAGQTSAGVVREALQTVGVPVVRA
ncbi:AAA family ATPase [Dactylosporangium sp. CS-047395]|uniref:AAA family ATPase n=1 Tax=Dactylosporangium sp. CS-047395 TaxID=3239936 RepID=UPI003D89EFE0